MDLTSILTLWASIPDSFKDISAIIGVLSVVAALTPTPVDNAILVALKKAINAGAFNFLNAENAVKPGSPEAAAQAKANKLPRKKR